jgi:hypothetical protein
VDRGIVVFTELMIDPSATPDTSGEWIELYNPTPHAIDLRAWILRDDGADLHAISAMEPVVVPAGGFAVLARSGNPALNCGISGAYQYSSFALDDTGDQVVLEVAGCEVDRLNYPVSFLGPPGSASNLSPSAFDAVSNDVLTNWCPAVILMSCGDRGTPGVQNTPCQ